jgi:hypothetical protein
MVRVQGLNGEWLAINIHGLTDGKSIKERIFDSFGLFETEEYVLFRKEISSAGSCTYFF